MERQRLRSGFTTGTCASAAAKAAAVFLLTGKDPGAVTVRMGNGERSVWRPEPAGQTEGAEGPESAGQTEGAEGPGRAGQDFPAGWWRVKKDAGDDPDVTDGAYVCAGVCPVTEAELARLCREGTGYWLEQYPGLYLEGGPGIGVARKPGLSCPVGHYAINPVPRRVILGAVDEACREAAYEGCLKVQIAIPSGEGLAGQTFNPRLGIVGGISVLGTTGIVEPMSEQALVETIRLEIHMKAVEGSPVLLLAPGNYGEGFLESHGGVPLGDAVKCSNFIGDSVRMAAAEGFRQILLAGHVGKLVKAAGGAENTHSRCGDRRMELMERFGREAYGNTYKTLRGGPRPAGAEELFARVRQANTTDEALEMLEAGSLPGASLAEATLAVIAGEVKGQMEAWGGKGLTAEAITFSPACGILGETKQAEYFLSLWKGWRRP